MNECISNHGLFLSENYIVQPIENVPVSIIDYDKIEMTHLIPSGQLSNGTPVIQLADSTGKSETHILHPLEAEIQRDIELKQQEILAKRQPPSVIQTTSLTGQDLYKNKSSKCFQTSQSLCNGILEVQGLANVKENETQMNFKDSTFSDIPSLNKPLVVEKRHFFIMSENSVVLDTDSRVNKDRTNDTNSNNDSKNTIKIKKPVEVDLPVLKKLNKELNVKEVKADSDSENEEDDIVPVYDYEPDPETPPTVTLEQNEKPNKCYMCFKSFRQKKNMYAHIRKIHSTQPKIEGGILCPLCKMHALRQEHLRTHLTTLHEIPIEKEEKLFSTMEEFLSWKEYIERETFSFYVSKSSSKLLANNQQKTYYKCHRSGTYVTLKKENRKKKLKVQGSNKIGATCPAAIEVTENTNGINVTFWKTHVGHDNDLAHLVLSKEEKAKVMEYVASGFSWDKILEIIKKEETSLGLPTKLATVSRQDLKNIKKVHDAKPMSEVFSFRKKNIQVRKPIKEKMLKHASQSLMIEKADFLLNLLETTDIRPEARPKVCLMIDNLISTIKRRAVKNSKKESTYQKRRQLNKRHCSRINCEREQPEI